MVGELGFGDGVLGEDGGEGGVDIVGGDGTGEDAGDGVGDRDADGGGRGDGDGDGVGGVGIARFDKDGVGDLGE